MPTSVGSEVSESREGGRREEKVWERRFGREGEGRGEKASEAHMPTSVGSEVSESKVKRTSGDAKLRAPATARLFRKFLAMAFNVRSDFVNGSCARMGRRAIRMMRM